MQSPNTTSRVMHQMKSWNLDNVVGSPRNDHKYISVVEGEKNPWKEIQVLGLRVDIPTNQVKVRFSLCVSYGMTIFKDKNGNSVKRRLFQLSCHHYSSEILCQEGWIQ